MAGWNDQVGYGVLHINGNNHGWSEKYVVKPSGSVTLASTQTAFALFVKFRQLLLAIEYKIVWARASLGDSSRDTLRCIDAPLSPLALSTEGGGITYSNDVKSGMLIRFETATGKWGNRILRGLRDGWVAGNEVNAITPTVPGSVTPGTDDQAGLTAAVALGNYIRAVMQYTQHAKESTVTPGTAVLTAWNAYNIRGISAHDTGRPFGAGRGRRPTLAE